MYNEIDFIRDVELYLDICDSDTNDDLCEETVHIYPYGKEKAIPYERSYHHNDILLLNNEYVTLIATKSGKSINLLTDYYTMTFFVVNKTDKKVKIDFDYVSINGYMANPDCYTYVSPGKSAFNSMEFATSDLEDLAITTVEEIEFTVTVKDYNNYKNKFVEEIIVVKAPN